LISTDRKLTGKTRDACDRLHRPVNIFEKKFFFHFVLLKRQPSLLEEALQKMSAIV
jgi:hypothetical protein